MPNLSQPVREVSLRRFGGLVTYVDPRDLPGGASPMCADVSFVIEGVGIRPGLTQLASSSASYLYFHYYSVAGVAQSLIQTGTTLTASPGGATYPTVAGTRAVGLQMPNGYLTLGLSAPGTPWQGSGAPLRVTPAGIFEQMGTSGPGVAPTITESVGVWRPTNITQAAPSRTVYSVICGVPLDDTNAPPPSNVMTFLGEVNAVDFNYGIYAGDYVYVSGAVDGFGSPNFNGTFQVIGTGNYTGRYGYQKYVQVRAPTSRGTFDGPFTGATLQKTRALVNVQPPLPAEGLVNSPTVSIGGTTTAANPAGIWNNAWPVVATPTLYELQITATQNVGNFAAYTFYAVGQANPQWQPEANVNYGDTIIDQYGHCWSVTVGGETGSSIPSFPASPATGATIADGTEVVWQYQDGMALAITVFNTTNGSGVFNVQNATVTGITAASQLTTNVPIASTVTNINESGYGILGGGALIVIDPGMKTVGTGDPGVNPIYAPVYAPQASATISVETPDLAPGQRYCVVLFQMDDGSITPASPPASFYTTGTTNQLTVSATGRGGTPLPLGPPGTVARIVAFTAAGAGIGGPYFYIPADVYLPPNAASLGQPRTVSATVINDNTTESEEVTFTLLDTVLLNSVNITETGNNRQQTRAIRPFAKALLDSGRCFYIGEQAAVTTLVNTDFTGGQFAGANNIPGWTFGAGTSQGTGSFTVSNSNPQAYLSLANGGSGALNPNPAGLAEAVCLTQSITLTAEQTPVLTPLTAYSVRVACNTSSTASGASLVVEVDSAGGGKIRSFTIPASSMPAEGTGVAEFTGEILLESDWGTGTALPATLGFYPLALPAGDAINVYRVDVFPTSQPYNSSQVAVSYAGDPAGVDTVTGVVDISDFTQDPITNIYRFLASVFVTTASRTFHVVTDAASEPAFWEVREIANRAGCSGPLAQDSAEEFAVTADVNGVYVFDGGTHLRISQEIQQLWNLVTHPELTWVKVDLPNQRILVGVCLPTPNTWLPNDPADDPVTPNVILACQYFGVETGRELGAEAPVTVSMFTGALLFREMRRKWTIWRVGAAYADTNLATPPQLVLGYGTKLVYLDPTVYTDLGAAIQQSYTTYAIPDSRDTEQLELGSHYHQYSYGLVLAEGAGSITILAAPENLRNTLPAFTQPGFTLADPALDDVNLPLNITGNRLFLTVAASGTGSWFNLRRIVLGVQEARRVTVRGQ